MTTTERIILVLLDRNGREWTFAGEVLSSGVRSTRGKVTYKPLVELPGPVKVQELKVVKD